MAVTTQSILFSNEMKTVVKSSGWVRESRVQILALFPGCMAPSKGINALSPSALSFLMWVTVKGFSFMVVL